MEHVQQADIFLNYLLTVDNIFSFGLLRQITESIFKIQKEPEVGDKYVNFRSLVDVLSVLCFVW